MTFAEIVNMGCAATVMDKDGMMRPCGRPVVAIRRWTGHGDGDGVGGVCPQHAMEDGAGLMPLTCISDDLAARVEEMWEDANDSSDHPDKDLLDGYGFYDGLTTAYENVMNLLMKGRTA